MTEVSLFALATLFGGMAFFAMIMAPLVFSKLPGDVSGPFIRQVFPVYYAYVFILAVAATLTIPPSVPSLLMALVAAITLVLRQWLMVRINAWSDAAKAGDEAAKRKFNLGHRASVVANIVQVLIVGGVLAQFAL